MQTLKKKGKLDKRSPTEKVLSDKLAFLHYIFQHVYAQLLRLATHVSSALQTGCLKINTLRNNLYFLTQQVFLIFYTIFYVSLHTSYSGGTNKRGFHCGSPLQFLLLCTTLINLGTLCLHVVDDFLQMLLNACASVK